MSLVLADTSGSGAVEPTCLLPGLSSEEKHLVINCGMFSRLLYVKNTAELTAADKPPTYRLSEHWLRESPDFGVFDVERVLQLVLPGQAAAQPLNHTVAQDLQVTPPARRCSSKHVQCTLPIWVNRCLGQLTRRTNDLSSDWDSVCGGVWHQQEKSGTSIPFSALKGIQV